MGTVTIDKAYFETLPRRAQSHADGVDYITPVRLATVTISKSEHDSLLKTARQFANLRQNLFRGGLPEETLAILTKDDSATKETERSAACTAYIEESQDIIPPDAPTYDQDYISSRDGHSNIRLEDFQNRANLNWCSQNMNDDESFSMDGPEDGFVDKLVERKKAQTPVSRPQYEKFAKRTVLLYNLVEGITHADITSVVRGGVLLDIYLRTHDRAASVSFLEGPSAQAFYRHVKRHDLYIRGKRTEIRWNDRQFILPGHVANKIGIGATRNLVVRNPNPKLTEETIRDDLEHIHNLVVIKVAIEDRAIRISTNSVHNSMFARTCMMSRTAYRGSKIEWGEDECAKSLLIPSHSTKVAAATKSQDTPLMNRFQLLNTDDSEHTSVDDDTSGVILQSTFTSSTIAV